MGIGRFTRLVSMLAEKRTQEHKERLILGAWIAFQLGAGGDMTFGDYLDKMRLGQPRPEAPRVSASDAIAKAEAILEMAREHI